MATVNFSVPEQVKQAFSCRGHARATTFRPGGGTAQHATMPPATVALPASPDLKPEATALG